jgi:hypothetical protein
MITFLRDYRFTFLLSSLLLLLVLIPIIGENHLVSFLLSLVISYTLLSCILVVSNNTLHFKIGLSLAVPYFILNWLHGYFPTIVWLERIDLIFGAFFFGFVTVVMLVMILKGSQVNIEVVFAALSAYLLIGVTWTFIYGIIDSYLPGSFNNIPADMIDPRYRFTYFSFVTLTTLGYGDITPNNSISQSWTVLEAIIGQIYLVVVISGLVGVYINRNRLSS